MDIIAERAHYFLKKIHIFSLTFLFPMNQVMGFSKDDGPIGAILNSYVHGPSSILGEMYSRGDSQQATQFMTTVSSVLNEDSLANPGSKGQVEREKVC